jgi:hypothetical protein
MLVVLFSMVRNFSLRSTLKIFSRYGAALSSCKWVIRYTLSALSLIRGSVIRDEEMRKYVDLLDELGQLAIKWHNN